MLKDTIILSSESVLGRSEGHEKLHFSCDALKSFTFKVNREVDPMPWTHFLES